MCGICGYVGIEEPGLVERMTTELEHRGPDDFGYFVDGSVALGHRRLSVIDLAGGHQPMTTPDGSQTITFNGEIYNFRELRESLVQNGHTFATDSDTEVLLRLYHVHGAGALERLNGMFAFGIYDRSRNELFLARDRVGIKPLYYLELPGKLLFASEAKALLHYDGWSKTLNAHALESYLALRYVPGDRGLIREIKRLAPGCFLRYRNGKVEIGRYWSPPVHAHVPSRPEQECVEDLAELMERSVRRRLISDVSFGAYLSGGLDSSVIVALMAKLSNAPVKTFTVGFGYRHDEVNAAAEAARLLGCDHHVVECRAEHMALLPEVVYHSDEPLGDAIAIPMFQLAREAKPHVTVVLTGEGADEMFGGYLFHKVMWAASLYRRAVPKPVRDWVVQPLLSLAPASLLNLAFRYPAYLGKRGKLKALDYLDTLGSGSLEDGYRHLISLFDARDTGSLFTDDFRAELRAQPVEWRPPSDTIGSEFDRMLRLQFGHWLPDNMLLRQDKMGMASAIEARVPFLDHEVVELAFRLPRSQRLRRLTGKHVLRRLASRLLPEATAYKRKMPFYVPLENYFQQPEFVAMMDDLLSEQSVKKRNIFRPQAVQALRHSMHQREFLLVKQVFSLMTLELWFRIFMDGGQRAVPVKRPSTPMGE